MERIKKGVKKVTDLVDHFKDKSDEIEMLDSRGLVLSFKEGTDSSTIEWILHLVQQPGKMVHVRHPFVKVNYILR